MSDRRKPERVAVRGPDGATPVGELVLTGVVKTSRGYAVAKAVLWPDGGLKSLALGHSQTQKEFVAREHVGEARKEAMRA